MPQDFAGTDGLTAYFADVHRDSLLSRDEENDLARRWRDHRDEAAANRLVTANLRFVLKVAMGFRRYNVPLPDLVQEGNLGLMHAVTKYDPDRGTRLISYAVWWIKAYIQAYVMRSWSLVRLGTTQTQRRLFYRLPGALSKQGRAAHTDEGLAALSQQLRARPEDVTRMMAALAGRDVSLDAPVDGEDGSTTFLDRVEGGCDPESATLESQDLDVRSRMLRDCLSALPTRERDIVRLRHMGERSRTLREVGEELGMSRERVRQLEAQAMRRLRAMAATQIRSGRIAA